MTFLAAAAAARQRQELEAVRALPTPRMPVAAQAADTNERRDNGRFGHGHAQERRPTPEMAEFESEPQSYHEVMRNQRNSALEM